MTGRDDSQLLSMAAAISEGTPIDWRTLTDGSSPADDEVLVDQLRVIDKIAAFHRRMEAEPERWGHLAILEKIGEGAFATVYRATDTKLQREVALKLLHPDVTPRIDPERALREARLLARVRHPNIVTVYGADTIDGRIGLWMELVKGRTLQQLLTTHGALGAREAAVIGVDLCRALAAVHHAGLIHGDIKPHNVMREEGGRAVLMDFGISAEHANRSAGLQSTEFAGTPLYLAPEVFNRSARTKASDIYSLGVLLFHAVTRAYPVAGVNRDDVQQSHERGERLHLRDARPDLPDEFVRAVEHAIQVNPADRFRSAGAFEDALSRFLGMPAVAHAHPRQWRGWAIGSAIAITLVVGGMYVANLRNAPRTTAITSVSAPPPLPANVETAAGSYQVASTLYRSDGDQHTALRPGSRVRPGDNLFVEIQVSVPAHVYIVNEDERGESYLLYPLPGRETVNPIPAGKRVRLPGLEGGRDTYWQVTSAGGREHFIIFASPEKLQILDEMFASLPRPAAGVPVQAAKLPPGVVSTLRGVGGLTSSAAPNVEGTLSSRFAQTLGESEETAHGLWVRQLTVENPDK
jgi:serine/threonine protein kinase